MRAGESINAVARPRPTPLVLAEDNRFSIDERTPPSPSQNMMGNMYYGAGIPMSPAMTWLAQNGQLFMSPNQVPNSSRSETSFWSAEDQNEDGNPHNLKQQSVSTPMTWLQYSHTPQFSGHAGMEAPWVEEKSGVADEMDLLKEIIPSPKMSQARRPGQLAFQKFAEAVENNKNAQGHKRQNLEANLQQMNDAKRRKMLPPPLTFHQNANNNSMKAVPQYMPSQMLVSPVHQYLNQPYLFPNQQTQSQFKAEGYTPIPAYVDNSSPTSQKCKDPGVKWTPEQDEQLKRAVEKFNGSNWKSIAKFVEGRNHVQCLQRWKKVLQPGLIKGVWSQEEDKLLMQLLEDNNHEKCWTKIAKSIPGRTAKQCRERYYLNLDPTINRAPWTQEEDDLLLALHRQLGNKWAEIKRNLPGRTENGVKSRFKSIQRAIRKHVTKLSH